MHACACLSILLFGTALMSPRRAKQPHLLRLSAVVCCCCVWVGVWVYVCVGVGVGGGLCACVCMFVYSIIWHCTDEPQKGETASFIEVVCSCMLLLHPAPTCADAGPSGTDLCTLHLWSTIQAEFLNALCPLPAYSAVSR